MESITMWKRRQQPIASLTFMTIGDLLLILIQVVLVLVVGPGPLSKKSTLTIIYYTQVL